MPGTYKASGYHLTPDDLLRIEFKQIAISSLPITFHQNQQIAIWTSIATSPISINFEEHDCLTDFFRYWSHLVLPWLPRVQDGFHGLRVDITASVASSANCETTAAGVFAVFAPTSMGKDNPARSPTSNFALSRIQWLDVFVHVVSSIYGGNWPERYTSKFFIENGRKCRSIAIMHLRSLYVLSITWYNFLDYGFNRK